VQRLRRDIRAIRPANRSAADKEFAKRFTTAKRPEYRPSQPAGEIDGLANSGVEHKLDAVPRDVPGLYDMWQRLHRITNVWSWHRSSLVWLPPLYADFRILGDQVSFPCPSRVCSACKGDTRPVVAWIVCACGSCQCPFHLKRGATSAGLDWWRSATTCVPEGKHFNFRTADPVAKIVVNSRQMNALHTPHPGVQCRGANSRLRNQKCKSLPQLFVQRAGRKGTILFPPNGGLVNMRVGALGDPNSHSLFSRDGGQASLAPLLQRSSRHDRPRR
jgi:hypothetical protein